MDTPLTWKDTPLSCKFVLLFCRGSTSSGAETTAGNHSIPLTNHSPALPDVVLFRPITALREKVRCRNDNQIHHKIQDITRITNYCLVDYRSFCLSEVGAQAGKPIIIIPSSNSN